MVIGYGQRDLDKALIGEIKRDINNLVRELESSKSHHVCLLTIPPQKEDSRKDEKSRELNRHIYQRCRTSCVRAIDCSLTVHDIARDNIHLNFKGKSKVARAIKQSASTNSKVAA